MLIKTFHIILCLTSLLGQIIGGSYLISTMHQYKLVFFLGIQFLLSLLFSYSISIFYQYRHSAERYLIILYISTFNTFIPIIGGTLIFILLFIINRHIPEEESKTLIKIDPYGYTPSIENLNSKFGPGGIRARLLKKDHDFTRKKAALFEISNVATPKNNQYLQEAKKDANDEIKLLAYYILQQQENTLTREIERTSLIIKGEISELSKFKAQKKIAQLYLQLVSLSLAHPETINEFLDRSLHNANAALSLLEDNRFDDKYAASIWTLLAQLYFRKKDIKNTLKACMKAKDNGASSNLTTPLVAEAYYKQKNYRQLKKQLLNDKNIVYDNQYVSIVYFWTSTDEKK